MPRTLFLILFLVVCSTGFEVLSQDVLKSFRLHGKWQRKYRVPCKIINNLVIVPVSVNGSDTLQMILDSGINAIIITELTDKQTVSLDYAREVELKGLGSQGGVMAYHSIGNEVKLGKLSGGSQDIFVLEPDRITLSAKMGITVNGLIGYPLFRDFVVEVDYSAKAVWFIPFSSFRQPRKYQRIPLTLKESKAMLSVDAVVQPCDTLKVNLLLDSGASSAIWLDSHRHSDIIVPQPAINDVLGEGLNGEITGQLARIESVRIGSYELRSIVAAFPDSGSLTNAAGMPDRQGSLGSEILRRFNYFVVYRDSCMYIRPNADFKQAFRYNISGIDVVKPYREVPVYLINRVRPGSAAARAGLLPDDQLVRVGGQLVKDLDIEEINHLVHYGRRGKADIEVTRNGKRLVFRFLLTDEI